ncbi:MAG: outer membrane beta-barrel protein [Massilia sp.]
MMFKKIAAAAVLATLAASSFAATPGVYAGLDVGSTKLDGVSGHETSFGGFVGYTFTQNFAAELGYRRLGKWDFAGGDVKADQTALSVVGTLPLSNGFNVFARLGYNNIEVKANGVGGSFSGNTNGGLYGVGVGYTFAPNIAARLEVQKPSSDSTNLGVSVVYSF